jgi:photosystem II stability/assembly factor-like uncharacterized protein
MFSSSSSFSAPSRSSFFRRNWFYVIFTMLFFSVRLNDLPLGANALTTTSTWNAIRHTPGENDWRGCDISRDGSVMAAAIYRGGIWVSKNAGERWTQTNSRSTILWTTIKIADSDPDVMIAMAARSHIYKTSDGGQSWFNITEGGGGSSSAMRQPSDGRLPWWTEIAMSNDGQYLLATAFNERTWVSNDYGATWSAAKLSTTGADVGTGSWVGCDISADGRYQIFVGAPNYLHVSNDYGATFTPTTGNTAGFTDYWQTARVSDSGQYMMAIVENLGYIHVSNDYGVTWTRISTPTGINTQNYRYCDVSGDGSVMMASIGDGYLVRSEDYGVTWSYLDGATDPGSREWTNIAISGDGKNILAISSGSHLYYGQFKCVSGTYGTYPSCQSCPEATCSFGGDGTDVSSCSASLCTQMSVLDTDVLVRDSTEISMTLPQAVATGSTLRVELYSLPPAECATCLIEFINSSEDSNSQLESDTAGPHYLIFNEGELEKRFKVRLTSSYLSSFYLVTDNYSTLPNAFPIFAPRIIQARKKKIFTPVINNGKPINQMRTYSFNVVVEAPPSATLIASGESFNIDIISSALIFQQSTGSFDLMLSSLTSGATESALRVYGVETGTQTYRIQVPSSTLFFTEYEYEQLATAPTISQEVVCGDNNVPELENVFSGTPTKKCTKCPTGTTARESATSLLDCLCPEQTVDIRMDGILPENYQVTLDTYPCVDSAVYCEDRKLDENEGTFQQCVDFEDGKPVGIGKNYYKFDFVNWQLTLSAEYLSSTTADGSVRITDKELPHLSPQHPVLSCEIADTCSYNASGLGSSGCQSGSEGPLCSVCTDDFYWHQDDEKCVKCTSNPDGYFSAEFLAVVICGLAVFLAAAFLLVPIKDKLDEIDIFRNKVRAEYRLRFDLFQKDVSSGKKQVQFQAEELTLKQRLEQGPQLPNQFRYKFGLKLYELAEDIAPKFKLMVGFVQILMLWPSTLYFIKWPKSLQAFVSAFKVLALDFEILPIDCVVKRDYYSNFWAGTISPFVLAFIVFGFFGSAALFLRSKGRRDSAWRYLTYGVKTMVIIIFIIYPSVSSLILEYFPCRNIGGGIQYLRYSIETECHTTRYDDFEPVVFFFLCLYVIGIPVLFLACMASQEYHKHFRFLLKDYKPKYWFFEILDMIRKLIIGVAIIFMGDPESDLQLYIIVFVSIGFLLILALTKPFKRDDDNVVAQVIQMDLGFIALIAIAIKSDSESLGSETVVNGLVAFAISIVVATCILTAAWMAFLRGNSRADFTRYDRDMSGDLDREELKLLLKHLGKSHSDEIINLVFSKFDRNAHESLDFEEFIEAGPFIHKLPSNKKNRRKGGEDSNAEEDEKAIIKQLSMSEN